jgi:hypothetical protein
MGTAAVRAIWGINRQWLISLVMALTVRENYRSISGEVTYLIGNERVVVVPLGFNP